MGKDEKSFDDYFNIETYKRPRFSSYLSDYSVPKGGTIALQVEVKGIKRLINEYLRYDMWIAVRWRIQFHLTRKFLIFDFQETNDLIP